MQGGLHTGSPCAAARHHDRRGSSRHLPPPVQEQSMSTAVHPALLDVLHGRLPAARVLQATCGANRHSLLPADAQALCTEVATTHVNTRQRLRTDCARHIDHELGLYMTRVQVLHA